jgi:hypothetical protein
MNPLHVYPTTDTLRHTVDPSERFCPCNPTVIVEGEEVIIIHNRIGKEYKVKPGMFNPNLEDLKRATVYTLIAAFLAIFWSLVFIAIANATPLDDETIIQCIMGEARGEGDASLLAHAYALRNRGTTKGVYGCQAEFTEPEWVWAKARKAVAQAKAHPNEDPTHGATHWASLIVDRKWKAKMERAGYLFTATFRNTAFYKEPKTK